MRLALALAVSAALLAAPTAATAADPPYNIPTADSGPSIPLVAALTLPQGQNLGAVLRKGLRLRVYAYKPIQFSITARLAAATARLVHARPGLLVIPRRVFRFDRPGVYERRVRLSHRAILRLRHAKRARFRLRTALSSSGSRTSTVSPITFVR